MPATIDFIFDFASPNGYFAYHGLKGVSERTGASVNYIPCLLGGIFKETGNQAPMMAFAGIKGKNEYGMLEIQRFIKKHGLSQFKMNAHFPVNTVTIQRGALVAQQDGRLEEYIAAGLECMWEDNQNMLERIQDPAIKQKLIDNTAMAVERGAFGIPTFYVGDEMFFGKERLGQVEEEAAA